MNAEAHLKSLGWSGPGTGLRAGSLQRAILTSKKTDLKGLGAKTNESDQWWDNIFSKQLSNIAVGPNGALAQINGGVSAAHPVAARNAHRKQFGEKSALEKVFVMGEVLKGNESFIPLANTPRQNDKPEAVRTPPVTKSKHKPRIGEQKDVKSISRKSSSEKAKKLDKKRSRSGAVSIDTPPAVTALPSPPLSDDSDNDCTKAQLSQLSQLSDKTLRKQARRLRRETKALEKAAKAARKEKRRLKKIKKLNKAVKGHAS